METNKQITFKKWLTENYKSENMGINIYDKYGTILAGAWVFDKLTEEFKERYLYNRKVTLSFIQRKSDTYTLWYIELID